MKSTIKKEEWDYSFNKPYYMEATQHELLSREEEISLIERIRKGDKLAQDELISKNQKLVISIAKYYSSNSGVELDDLVQEGNLGLVVAIEKFEIDKNVKFATYATRWIKHAIIRAIENKSRNIRIPIYIQQQIRNLKTSENVLKIKLKREPSLNELSEYTKIPPNKIIELKFVSLDTLSLNSLVSEEGVEMEYYYADDGLSVEELYLEKDLSNEIKYLLENSGLTYVEKMAIKGRFLSGQVRTYEYISLICNCSIEWVRKGEMKALKKMRKKALEIDCETFLDLNNNKEIIKK